MLRQAHLRLGSVVFGGPDGCARTTTDTQASAEFPLPM